LTKDPLIKVWFRVPLALKKKEIKDSIRKNSSSKEIQFIILTLFEMGDFEQFGFETIFKK
jgi:hypothetical protein